MEKRFLEIADKIAKFTTKKSYIAFLDDGGNLLYSTLTAESEEAVKKLRSIFPVWNIGDYQLKKLPKSNILVYKVSPRIVLALESYEKEGVLIVVGKRLEENFADIFKSLESQLPAVPIEELIEVSPKESSLGLVQEGSSTEKTKMAESTPTEFYPEEIKVERSLEPFIKPSLVGEGEETVSVSFPILTDKKILKKVKEPMVIAILDLCDGDHTVDDIAEELRISKARVMITTGDFSAKGAIRYVSGVRKIRR